MKCSIVHLGLVIALAWSLSSTLQGEQLKEGTWSGSWVNVGGSNDNPRPRSLSIEVKKGPDPHWRWRLGQGELLTAIIVASQGVRSQLGNVELDKGTLSYSFQHDDATVNCRLSLREDGVYEGDCVGPGRQGRRHLTLTPPEDSPKR